MNTAPEFAAYPVAPAPVYSRWLAWAVALLVLSGSAAVSLSSFIEPRMAVVGGALTVLLWMLALLLRVVYVRFNRHNALCYAEAAQQVSEAWWKRHREKVALVESVLLGATCTKSQHGLQLFSPAHRPPLPAKTDEGQTIRLGQVFGKDVAERECNLAILLALQWQQQRTDDSAFEPLRCYWQGSLAAWQAFVEQMARCSAQVHLPEQPEPWQGMQSLDALIDQLQGAPASARILCAGCQSSPLQPQSRLPAGEAAVLWVLGPEGGVGFSRGEWFAADTDSLPAVARRALQQSELAAPTPICVSFSQPNVPDLSATGWNTRQHVQDANFGLLDSLQAMVVQTLAAWYVEQHQEPCAWLANDPHHTLALGIVHPHDSNS